MRFFTLSAALTTFVITPLSAKEKPLPLIPLPKTFEKGEGAFRFSIETSIHHDTSLGTEAKLLATDLARITGKPPQLHATGSPAPASAIRLELDPAADLAPSGYRLEITPQAVRITGKDAAGVFHGTRTLLQMLPPGKTRTVVELTTLRVTDAPRFGWRGTMLDVGRHYVPVTDIKAFLDGMAFHKLNVFHWHLTEDQGWRIEIRKYPKLTEFGAYRESSPPYGDRNGSDGTRYGGFYTQEEIKDIVAYAAARHITVVPEIDMPGHMSAAIAAYPELGNSDIPDYAPKVQTHWGVHPYVLAPTEEVFRFVDDVLTELCDLFPSAYIHIGGDEAPKTQWEQSPRVRKLMEKEGLKNGHEVQSYFIKRVEKLLAAKGRKLIGWDEIREGGLSPEATVMSWRGEAGGIASAKEGHDVVMSPNSHMYFDHYQAPADQELAKGKEYEAIGGMLPIGKVYSYNPIPSVLSEKEGTHILGVQANLWSEYFKDFRKVQYHAFPRLAALSEVAWTSQEKKDYTGFRERLEGILVHYDAAGIHRGEPYDPPDRKTRDGSTVETSLGIHEGHWPEFAFDGRTDSFFWSDRELRTGDYFTLHFKSPIAEDSAATVKTGGLASRNGDRLENGVLESSMDGMNWDEIGTFQDGAVRGLITKGMRHLRIKVTAPQTNWLIVHEIEVH